MSLKKKKNKMECGLINCYVQVMVIVGIIGIGFFLGVGCFISLIGFFIVLIYMIIGVFMFFMMCVVGEMFY